MMGAVPLLATSTGEPLQSFPLTEQSTEAPVEVLAARAAKGDNDALGALYALHAAATLRWIRAKVTDHDTAEDINAETWVVVVRSISTYQQRAGSAGWLGWLFTITRTKMLDWFRAQTRRVCREVREQWSESEAFHPRTAVEDGPEAHVDRLAVATVVRQAMTGLPPSHLRVLELRFWCQMSVGEAAAELGRSPSWVTTTQHRAVVAMRKQLPEDARELARSA